MAVALVTFSATIAPAGLTASAVIAAAVVEGMVGESGGDDRCIQRNRCLHVKATFTGSAKSSANTAFTARAVIMYGGGGRSDEMAKTVEKP